MDSLAKSSLDSGLWLGYQESRQTISNNRKPLSGARPCGRLLRFRTCPLFLAIPINGAGKNYFVRICPMSDLAQKPLQDVVVPSFRP